MTHGTRCDQHAVYCHGGPLNREWHKNYGETLRTTIPTESWTPLTENVVETCNYTLTEIASRGKTFWYYRFELIEEATAFHEVMHAAISNLLGGPRDV